jgi:membrane associated rhomboid family serine protease
MGQRGPASDFRIVASWLALLWAIFIIDVVLRVQLHFQLAEVLGLRPREPWGLVGIVTAHFLHANAAHLIANSVALLILGLVSCGYGRKLTAIAIAYAMLGSGILAWCIGSWHAPQPTIHLGASGVIFGLIGFLMANGIFRRGLFAMLLAVLVVLFYAGALVAMFPQGVGGQPISWEMHLGGFIGGVAASWHQRKRAVA